jgi:hypothetical protein
VREPTPGPLRPGTYADELVVVLAEDVTALNIDAMSGALDQMATRNPDNAIFTKVTETLLHGVEKPVELVRSALDMIKTELGGRPGRTYARSIDIDGATRLRFSAKFPGGDEAFDTLTSMLVLLAIPPLYQVSGIEAISTRTID